MKKIFSVKKAILAFLLGAQLPLFAQESAAVSEGISSDQLLTFVLILMAFVMILVVSLVFYFANAIIERTKDALPPEKKEAFKDVHLLPSFSWTGVNKVLTDAIPIEKESDILLDHDYDGIKELDNHLPPWWVWMFYGTVGYAVIYIFFLYVVPESTTIWVHPEVEYAAEMRQAEIEKAERLAMMADFVDETSVELLGDAASLKLGKELYNEYCAVCHGEQGQGGTGPTFADSYWLHGNGIKDIFKTIKYGIQGKGMAPWEAVLSPGEMAKVASYVTTFEGTSPPNMKDPQGELMAPSGSEEEVISDESEESEEEAAPADSTANGQTALLMN